MIICGFVYGRLRGSVAYEGDRFGISLMLHNYDAEWVLWLSLGPFSLILVLPKKILCPKK